MSSGFLVSSFFVAGAMLGRVGEEGRNDPEQRDQGRGEPAYRKRVHLGFLNSRLICRPIGVSLFWLAWGLAPPRPPEAVGLAFCKPVMIWVLAAGGKSGAFWTS